MTSFDDWRDWVGAEGKAPPEALGDALMAARAAVAALERLTPENMASVDDAIVRGVNEELERLAKNASVWAVRGQPGILEVPLDLSHEIDGARVDVRRAFAELADLAASPSDTEWRETAAGWIPILEEAAAALRRGVAAGETPKG